MSSTPAVEVEGLTFSYGSRHPILEDVDFSIQNGDFASVIGPNGGGKTTLLRLIVGLLDPDRGRIRVFGRSPRAARPRIGYMPQHTRIDPLFPVRALDVVLTGRLGPSMDGWRFTAEDRTAARDALRDVGMEALASEPFSALSGGQRQRVVLARALACRPELLLLDEPAAGFDRRVELEFFELLKRINREATILLVSHDLGFVSAWVHTVVCVNRRVHVHPTASLDTGTLRELYGVDVRAVRHDQDA